jgi:hypothetical protein
MTPTLTSNSLSFGWFSLAAVPRDREQQQPRKMRAISDRGSRVEPPAGFLTLPLPFPGPWPPN